MLLMVIVVFAVIFLMWITSFRKTGDRDSKRNYRQWNHYETTDGADFEKIIEFKLSRLEKAGGLVLSNCYFRLNGQATTEIDHILIFRSGVYVIECKDYSGWIFGTGKNENWTQTLPPNRRDGESVKNSFYNPIKQNANHIRIVRNKLHCNRTIPFHNIIVFDDNCTLKRIDNTCGAYVINACRLYETINAIDQKVGSELTMSDVQDIYIHLKGDSESDDSVKAEHILYVNRIKNQKMNEKYSTYKTCPRCGYPLVLRNGQYGRFYGCSRYPNCKYTKQSNV